MKVMVINGPNLNMLGIRERNIYGDGSYDELVRYIKTEALHMGCTAECRQSNHEGEIIDWIQNAYFEKYDGIVINPGGYTHTSVAIADAVAAVAPLPVVEVHISDTDAREDFRKISYLRPHCVSTIQGKGFFGYILAIEELQKHIQKW